MLEKNKIDKLYILLKFSNLCQFFYQIDTKISNRNAVKKFAEVYKNKCFSFLLNFSNSKISLIETSVKL